MVALGAMFDLDPALPGYCRMLEEHGFEHLWVNDSHIESRELSVGLTLGVLSSSRLQVGSCVTNPVTRHPTVLGSLFATLQELSGGRMILGLGKGDGPIRRLGEKPPSLSEFMEQARFLKAFVNGEKVSYRPRHPGRETWHAQAGDELKLSLKWATGPRVPLFVAGYSPKMLEFIGEVADGAFLQVAEPSTVAWAIERIGQSARRHGRNPADIQIVCCTATAVGADLHQACESVRSFPAFVTNHVLDMLRYYKPEELPPALLRGLESKSTYDYAQHARRGAGHDAFVSDELVESFAVVGDAPRCAEKLTELAHLGVNQLCLYMFDMERAAIEATLIAYEREIMPAVGA